MVEPVLRTAGRVAEGDLRGATRAGGVHRDGVLLDAGPGLGGEALAPGDAAAGAGGGPGPLGPGGRVTNTGTDGVLHTFA